MATRIKDFFSGTHVGFLKSKGYKEVKKIAEGGSGKVYSAFNEFDQKVALKEVDLINETAIREIYIQKSLAKSLPGLMPITAIHVGSDFVFTERPYAFGGTLQEYIDKKEPIGSPMKIIYQMLCGVNSLHTIGLLHLDIKPSNILLLSPNTNAVISDFGTAVKEGSLQTRPSYSLGGTPEYTAPELFCNISSPSKKSDIWSLGLILFQLANKFAGVKESIFYRKIDPRFISTQKVNVPFETMLLRLLIDQQNLSRKYGHSCETFVRALKEDPTSDKEGYWTWVNALLRTQKKSIDRLAPDNLFLYDLAEMCLSLDPRNRVSSVKELLDMFEMQECKINRFMNTFSSFEASSNEEKVFSNALLKYAVSSEIKEEKSERLEQLEFILSASRRWKLDDELSRMIIRVLNAMLYWGTSKKLDMDHCLWCKNDKPLKTFLREIGLYKRGIQTIQDLDKAILPFIETLSSDLFYSGP